MVMNLLGNFTDMVLAQKAVKNASQWTQTTRYAMKYVATDHNTHTYCLFFSYLGRSS